MADRKTITQRIALEGGDGVRAQFEAIGKAGQAAFKSFQDAGGASAIIGNFGNTLDGVKAKAAAIGAAARKLGDDFNNLGTRVAGSARNLTLIGAAIAGVAIGFTGLVRGAGEATDKLREQAEQIGVTVEQLNGLQFAFQQNGVNSEQLGKGLVKLNTGMEQAAQHAKDTRLKQGDLAKSFAEGKVSLDDYSSQLQKINRDASENGFTKLGITVTKSNGELRNTHDVLLDVADAFKKMPDGAKKSAIAVELFGKGNSKMISALKEGRGALLAYEKEQQRVAPTLGDAAQKAADKMGDAFEIMGKAASSTKQAIAATFAPTVQKVVDAITESIVRNRAAMISFAESVASKAKPVVEDLIALLEGRDKDVKNSAILRFRDGVLEFGRAVTQTVTGIVIPAFQAVIAAANTVAVAINGIFGSNVNGQTLLFAAALFKVTGVFGVLRAAIPVIVSAVGLLVATFGALPVILTAIGVALGFFLVQAVGGLKGLQDAWNKTWAAISAFVTREINGIAVIAGGLVTAFTTVVAAIVAVFSGLADALTAAFQAVVALAQSTWDAIVQAAVNIGTGIVTAFQSALSAVGGFFKGLVDSALGLLKQLLDFATKVANAVKAAFGGGNTTAPPQGAAPGLAGGGAVYGPGSTTSDSIWARLSNKEFVQRASAVRMYGLKFMNAINQGLISPDLVRGLMGGMSGVVDRVGSIMPGVRHFADGGLAVAGAGGGGLQPVHLHLGSETFPVQASGDVVDRLTRYATQRQLRSAGRAPNWFK